MNTPVKCPLREASLISGNEPAVVTDGGALTYQSLEQVTSGTVLRLVESGIGPGDRVGVRLENDWEAIPLIFALLRLGAVVCPVSTRWPEATAMERLAGVGASVCVVRAERVSAGSGLRTLAVGELVELKQADASRVPKISLALQQEATIFFTSGSGGEPKAVLHTYGNHYYSALGSNRALHVGSGDRWAWSLPLVHVGGFQILFRCFLGGAAVIVPADGVPLHEVIAGQNVTHVSMVPTQLKRYLDAVAVSSGEASPLRTILLGGGPAPAGWIQRAQTMGLQVRYSYGSTEMTSQIATSSGSDTACGPVLRYREVRIAEDGEIWVRGKTRFSGYVRGDALDRPFDEDGWFATGDLGAWDADGCLSVVGRKDNQFISGGENIHPEEIERALMEVDGIEEAVVVPVDHPEFGKRPVAFVRAREGERHEADWARALASRLPGFMIPDTFLSWPDDIGGAGMKPDRAALARAADQPFSLPDPG